MLRRTVHAALVLTLIVAASGSAQVVDEELFATDGQVNAVLVSGSTLYVGGTFRRVGRAVGSGVPIHSGTGEVSGSFPRISGGSVFAVVPDGFGGWYIGGSFTSVGRQNRAGLAHVLSDGSVASWNPSANGEVFALSRIGSAVFAGGLFSSIGGAQRTYVAALDATTAVATSWTPDANGPVYALAASGSVLYAGGAFTNIGDNPGATSPHWMLPRAPPRPGTPQG